MLTLSTESPPKDADENIGNLWRLVQSDVGGSDDAAQVEESQ